MRILTSFFAEYFETVSGFEAYNLQQLSLSVAEAETSDEDDDDDDDEESMSSEEEASKAAKRRRRRQRQTAKTIPIPIPITQPIDQSNDNVVKSPDYYKSMHREITLLIFRYHCLRVIQIADSIGFDRLTSRERLLAAFMKDFALKKNFISGILFSHFKTRYINLLRCLILLLKRKRRINPMLTRLKMS